MRTSGIRAAVDRRDTDAIFDWLIGLVQLQGISDRAAFGFSARHGLPSAQVIRDGLHQPKCSRLASYWHFAECGYLRSSPLCAEPACRADCLVHQVPARNGRLAQAAASLSLFLRDHCQGDLVAWIDRRLAEVDTGPSIDVTFQVRDAVLKPLTHVFGISNKVVSMAMADLLIGGSPDRTRWVRAGAAMTTIDSLVHNFMHRTGITARCGKPHAYGPACYGEAGCAKVLETLAVDIDARQFSELNPAYFPRLLSVAIWAFCAEGRLDICNGNRIDDALGCAQRFCPIGPLCPRVALRPIELRR